MPVSDAYGHAGQKLLNEVSIGDHSVNDSVDLRGCRREQPLETSIIFRIRNIDEHPQNDRLVNTMVELSHIL